MQKHLIPFHQDTITAYETPDGIFIAMKPICERLGLDWRAQQRKLVSSSDLGYGHMTIPSEGGDQVTGCIPLSKLAAWLFSVNPSKVKECYQDGIRLYRREAAEVLDQHFRLKNAESKQAIAKLKAQRAALGHLCCAFNPLWAKIYALHKAGVPRSQVHMIVRRPESHIFAITQLMETHHIIAHDGWRDKEMAFGIFDPLHPLGEFHVNFQREMREEAKAAKEAHEKAQEEAKAALASGEMELTPVEATPFDEPTPLERLLTDPDLMLPEDAPEALPPAPSTDTLQ